MGGGGFVSIRLSSKALYLHGEMGRYCPERKRVALQCWNFDASNRVEVVCLWAVILLSVGQIDVCLEVGVSVSGAVLCVWLACVRCGVDWIVVHTRASLFHLGVPRVSLRQNRKGQK